MLARMILYVLHVQLSGGCDMPHSRVHKDAYAAHTIRLVPFLLKKLLTYNGHIDIDEFFVRNDEWVTSKANQQRLKDLPYNLRVQTCTILSYQCISRIGQCKMKTNSPSKNSDHIIKLV